MPAKSGKSKEGHLMHYSSSAIIKRDGKILMIDRTIAPLGFACPAGHLEEGETPDEALYREVEEETGLKIKKCKFLIEEEVDGNICSRGVAVHYWYVYECECAGEPKLFPAEEKSIGWYTPEQIKTMTLEPVWDYWLKKFKVI
ncbi:MAG: NUDIX domain-containing protein [Patescibacteria group bacterium]|nr:NUDIX domain-containing protein [Patescibacteria group bacterium]